MESPGIRQIVVELSLRAPVETAWKLMVEHLPDWWPADFLCFPEAERIRFEPWAGGRLWEEAPDGRQILWANVLMILPGRAIEFVGYMTPTYGGPSLSMYRLEVTDAGDGTTRFRLTDSVLGLIDEEHQASLNEGWTYLFGKLKEYVEARA